MLEPYAGQERVHATGPAGRRGPAADAGRERHLPRLAARPRARRRDARLLRAPAVGLEELGGPSSAMPAAPASTSTRGCAAWTLARAHARSGDRIAIAAYLGSGDAFDRAIAALRRRLRRPERARLRGVRRRRADRAARRDARPVGRNFPRAPARQIGVRWRLQHRSRRRSDGRRRMPGRVNRRSPSQSSQTPETRLAQRPNRTARSSRRRGSRDPSARSRLVS